LELLIYIGPINNQFNISGRVAFCHQHCNM
jgi:hypothetical protein